MMIVFTLLSARTTHIVKVEPHQASKGTTGLEPNDFH